VGVSSAAGALAFGTPASRAARAAAGPAGASPAWSGAPAIATATQEESPAAVGRSGLGPADETPAAAPTPTAAAGRTAPTGAATGGVPPTGERPPVPAAPPASADVPSPADAAEVAVLTLVNQARARINCAALSVDPRLAGAARAHSADMANRDYFAHDTPEGVNVGTRVTNAGYRWSAVGENIAKGQPDAAAVMLAWLNSPGHRANILNCRYTNIGIGLAFQDGTPLWTQDFGTPLS
jgi:uncharacterized protein YkwD